MADINGTSGNDNLVGTAGNDNINGLAGNDIINAGDGDDSVYGGDGDDTLSGSNGNDTLNGGDGDDVLRGGPGADIINGGIGDDIFFISDADGDTIDGGAGADRMFLELSSVSGGVTINLTNLWGGGTGVIGSGTIVSVEMLTTGGIIGTAFADSITVGAGYLEGASVEGRGGNDTLNGSSGNDLLDGGDGDDVVSGFLGDDTLIGGNGNDRLYGDVGADRLNGDFGDDTLFGGAGNDVVLGGDGNDILLGEDGDDTLNGGDGTNVLAGGNGNDTLTVTTGGNEINGGAGNDIYVVAGRTDTIVEAANGGTDEVRTTSFIYDLNSASNVEKLTFTDNLQHAGVGNALDNILVAGTAADELQGRGGNDLIYGGSGSANTLLGGTGDDIYYVEASGDTVIEYANEGIDTVSTALSVFYLRDNLENLAYTGNGTFSGVGSADNNTISAGAGADFLNGADGNDILTGGSGADLMIGGNGADQFRYVGGETGYDRILDFTPGTDKIALNGSFFAHTATIAFIATGAPVATSANSTFLYDVNSGILSYDADGNGAGAAVQLAQLNTGLTLSLGDFVFF